jgi:hypothetical protein
MMTLSYVSADTVKDSDVTDPSVTVGEMRNNAGFTFYQQSDAEAYHKAKHDGGSPSDPSEHRDGGFCGLCE